MVLYIKKTSYLAAALGIVNGSPLEDHWCLHSHTQRARLQTRIKMDPRTIYQLWQSCLTTPSLIILC